MDKDVLDLKLIRQVSDHLYEGVTEIIDDARTRVAVYVNSQTSMTFWNVGRYIIDDMDYQTYSAYGQKILATLSQRLMARLWQRILLFCLNKNDESCPFI